MTTDKPQLILWGVIASPYLLKMQALGDYRELPWQRWPEQASLSQALGTAWRLKRGRRRQSIERYPLRVDGMDEYPSVPYYSLDGKQLYYDSTGLARHLDAIGGAQAPLIPTEPTVGFICKLIDEAFDEFGLYMVHHNRWVTSATTNIMGKMTSREMRKLLPPGIRQRVARTLPQRQVRRCPYLFSVAPENYRADVPESLTPPYRAGFPPTHDLLDTAWRRYLAAIEQLLEQQPYLLGERFSLADASAYGQLSMNLVDGRAAELLEQLAPRTFQWLCAIRDGAHRGSRGNLQLSDGLTPLIDIIGETFLPLMQQNAAAYQQARAQGQTLFNEAAFDRGEALYDGKLLNQPFRSVAKSFQVLVWQELCDAWHALSPTDRGLLQERYPALAGEAFSFTRS
jgi:glutathione S-transferase